MPDRFKNSRQMVRVILVSAVLLQIYAIYIMGAAAAPILTTTLPAMLILAGAYAKITNDAETKEPK